MLYPIALNPNCAWLLSTKLSAVQGCGLEFKAWHTALRVVDAMHDQAAILIMGIPKSMKTMSSRI